MADISTKDHQAVMQRLAGVLGMLGSNSDNEALTAARMAERLRRELNAQWSDLLSAAPAAAGQHGAECGAAPYPAAAPHWTVIVERALHSGCPLSVRDQNFVLVMQSYRERGQQPSPRQMDWIESIAVKIGMRE